MFLNYHSILTFLNSSKIPTYERSPKTFLEIAKQPRYENVISNIYAFFFDSNEEHGLGDLFMRALVDCIHSHKDYPAQKEISYLSDYYVETEFSTDGLGKKKKRGRIDLLLTNNAQTIIIESKIDHHLDNDLDDYWLSTKSIDDNAKVGIILSIKPISKDKWQYFEKQHEYINLTHLSLINRVIELSKPHLEKLNNHFKFILNDFCQNIIKISQEVMESEDLKFYFENQEKINQLVNFKFKVRDHIVQQIEHAGNSIADVNLVNINKRHPNSKRLRYFQSIKHGELLYTIVFENLLQDSNVLYIIIEFKGRILKNGEIFRAIEFTPEEIKILHPDFYNNLNKTWAHFASKEYKLSNNDLANLSEFIQTKVHNDGFETVFYKLGKRLVDLRNTGLGT